MAYPYFPATYNNPYLQQQNFQPQQNFQQQLQQSQVVPQQPQVVPQQQAGLVIVQSEQEARSYPVAPGNSITFKDESQPYCYVKSMGFNQLDRPVFEKYRLVKEDEPVTPQNADLTDAKDKDIPYALKSDLEALRDEIEALKEKMKKRTLKVKKEVDDDGE